MDLFFDCPKYFGFSSATALTGISLNLKERKYSISFTKLVRSSRSINSIWSPGLCFIETLLMSLYRSVLRASKLSVLKLIEIVILWVYYTIPFGFSFIKRKRKRSDSVLWQNPLHQQKCQKGKVTTQTTPQKSSITQRLRTNWGRSVGVTTATQLVWLIWFTGPTFPLPATAVLSKGHTFKMCK